jgi:hypothetical protein
MNMEQMNKNLKEFSFRKQIFYTNCAEEMNEFLQKVHSNPFHST